MSFRATAAQALGRGAWLGGVTGVAISALGGMAACLAIGAAGTRADVAWFVVLSPLVLGPLAGAVSGVAVGRDDGADIDDNGIHLVPAGSDGYAPWQHVEDLRAERRGGRIRVAVYLDTGRVTRLGAPYDGRLLAHDPAFERKLFMLRHLWEMHRSLTLNKDRHPSGGRG